MQLSFPPTRNPRDQMSRIRRDLPWPAIVGGLGLLAIALFGCGAALWLLWGSLFAPDGSQVFGPGAAVYQRSRAAEVVELVQHLSGNPRHPFDPIGINADRIKKVLARAKGQAPFVNRLEEYVIDLQTEQAAEVRAWRVEQLLLLALPILLAAGTAGWIGWQVLWRDDFPRTVLHPDEIKPSTAGPATLIAASEAVTATIHTRPSHE